MTKQVGKITDFKKWDAARKLETSSFLGAQAENLSMGTGFWQPAAFAFWKPNLIKVHICAEQQGMVHGSHTSMAAVEMMEGSPLHLAACPAVRPAQSS